VFILKKVLFPIYLIALLIISTPSFADDGGIGYPAKIFGKLGIGIINAATGIIEIPKSMTVESQQEGIGMGLSVGLLKGLGNTLGRSILGVADVVTFPIPTKPMLTPPVVFQDFSTATEYSNGWELY
jgi:putative exosortase-associated protein (TIGR04073 family)